MPESPDELEFANGLAKLEEIIPKLNQLIAAGRGSLRSQQYRLDNNHLRLVEQDKQIEANKGYIAEAEGKAKAIISAAEARAKDIEKSLSARVVEVNSMERRAAQKVEDAEKKVWESKSDKKRLAAA